MNPTATIGPAPIERLLADWRTALDRANRYDDRDDYQTAEQRAWDTLIDAVEERGLQYTEYDPRHSAR